MEAHLTVCVVFFTLKASEWIEWENGSASALRGALLEALRQRFCPDPEQAQCACIAPHCPVAELVAPVSGDQTRGADAPRPLVLRPPTQDGAMPPLSIPISRATQRTVLLKPEEGFSFTVILVGQAIQRFPAVIVAARAMEQLGLGRPLHANGGRRGRFTLETIEAIQPFTGERMSLFERGQTHVQPPPLIIGEEDVQRRASALPEHELQLHFLSPTRLIDSGKLARVPDPGIVLRRLAERLDALAHYAQPAGASEPAGQQEDGTRKVGRWYPVAQGANLSLGDYHVTWLDTKSHSTRQQRQLPIGGLIGNATFRGKLTPAVRELLTWGELVHVGKDAMKGDGWYRIEA